MARIFWAIAFIGLGLGACAVRREAKPPKIPPPATKPATAPTSAPIRTEATTAPADMYPVPRVAPYLTADESLKTFKLPPGFRIEVVAEEPMVQQPVAMTFDPDGRLWVVEMRGYMQTPEGANENAPTGRVSVLQDTNGDGRMDKSVVFLDDLVMPRAISLVRDGVLIGVPPSLLFCRDTNGDGVADEQTIVATDYGDDTNPEHQANGLLYGLDNWLHNADFATRYKPVHGKWVVDSVPDVGQWGIAQDDYGRMFTNNNSDYLRVNLFSSHYATRNPNYVSKSIYTQVAADQACWPAHSTAINRGYRENFLRDGRLRAFTGACGPCIYRGDLFPEEFRGNAFVGEVTANLIRRAIVTEEGASLRGRNAYEKDEFLTSTHERFRPVNLYTGPEGALYVVDIHNGLIQHKNFLTPYGKQQYLARTLNKHLNTGRIFRIVPEGYVQKPSPALSRMKASELAEELAHPNGWRRDTAQRLLVERNEPTIVPKLAKLATSSDSALGRVHALWTLEGMRRLSTSTLRTALVDPEPKVRATAIRLAEPFIGSDRRAEVLPQVLALAGDPAPDVRVQFALTVSEIGGSEADAALVLALTASAGDAVVRDAVLTGLRAREMDLIERLVNDSQWSADAPGRKDLLTSLGRCVVKQRDPKRVSRLIELIASEPPTHAWRQIALLDSFTPATANATTRPIRLDTQPPAIAELDSIADPAVVEKVLLVKQILNWPGKPGYKPPPPPKPLNRQEQARFDAGKIVYTATCVQCHKADGMGQASLAPPLANSEWTAGPDSRLVRILLNGLRGPVTVDGTTFNLDMPNLAALSDEQIAAVLTYVRRSFGNEANPVTPETVAKLRAECAERGEAWTERELLKLK